MQNKGYYAFKVIEVGTNRKPVCDFLLVIIVTDNVSRTVSEWSQLIVQILDTLHCWAPLWGLRDNIQCSSWAHWKVHSGLPISVNWTFFARCYSWVDRKLAILLECGRFDPTVHIQGVATTNHFCKDSSANECLTTLLLTVFTQRNLVGDLAKWNFRWKTAVVHFWAPLWGV